MLKINPLKLLVSEIKETENVTKSGILIPNAVVKVENMKGRVEVVGEGTKDIQVVWNVGDTVLFHPRAGSKIKHNDIDYRLIDVNEVLLGGV